MLAVGPKLLGGLTETNWFSVVIFTMLCVMLVRTATKKIKSK
jgi:hypothetical protein